MSACVARGSGLAATGSRVSRACSIAPRRRGGSRIAPPPDRVAVIVALRRLRMTAAEIAETLGMALSTVSWILTRAGWAGSAGSGSSSRSATSARGRASSSTSTSRSSAGSRAAPASASADGAARTTTHDRTDAAGARRDTVGWEYVHVAVDDYSRLAYAEVLADEKAVDRRRLPPPRARLLPPPRHPGRADPDRQRLLLPRRHPRARLPRTSASATAAPAPTGPKQTAKPSASSAPSSTAGPTARSTAQATNAPPPLTAGSGTTTIDRRHSALGHQPPVSRTNLLGSYN